MKPFNYKDEHTSIAFRITNVRRPFDALYEYRTSILSKQTKLLDIIIDQLNNHGLFSTILSKGRDTYKFALSKKYPTSDIEILKVHVNRFNVSLTMMDHTEEKRFGSFRYRTDYDHPIEGSLTANLAYNNQADKDLVEDLSAALHEAEQIAFTCDTGYYTSTSEKDIDLSKDKFVDLCSRYTKSMNLTSRLTRLGYGDLTANQFYAKVNLKKLGKKPGIGHKTIDIIKQIYTFYGLGKPNDGGKD
jgi:hypothetical protein